MDDYNYGTWSELVVTETTNTATIGELNFKTINKYKRHRLFFVNY